MINNLENKIELELFELADKINKIDIKHNELKNSINQDTCTIKEDVMNIFNKIKSDENQLKNVFSFNNITNIY